MKLRLTLGLALLLCGLAAILLWHRSPRLNDEEQILKLLDDLRLAVEARNVGRAMAFVAEDYHDGTHTKRDLTRLAVTASRSSEQIHLHLDQPTLDVEGARARVRLRAAYWFGPGPPPEGPKALDVAVALVRRGRAWQIVKATGWESVAGEAE